MRTSEKGLELIKEFEGCRLTSYKCPAGVWTIGYGHTEGVRGGQSISSDEASELLRADLRRFEDGVNRLVEVDLTQGQFDALVSFAFNVGLGNLQRSTLLRKVNGKKLIEAGNEFEKWVRGGGRVLPGLVRRRKAERKHFNEYLGDWQ